MGNRAIAPIRSVTGYRPQPEKMAWADFYQVYDSTPKRHRTGGKVSILPRITPVDI